MPMNYAAFPQGLSLSAFLLNLMTQPSFAELTLFAVPIDSLFPCQFVAILCLDTLRSAGLGVFP